MAAFELVTHLAYDGGWNRIQQPLDVIELFSTDAHVSLAVSSVGRRATQPYDDGLGNSLRTPAAHEQLFEDVESGKPRLMVAYLHVRHQEYLSWLRNWSENNAREDGKFSDVHPTHRCCCFLATPRRDSFWSTELWMARLRTPLKRRRDFGGLRRRQFWRVVYLRRLVSFKNLDGKCGDDMKSPFMCQSCQSHLRTHLDLDGNIFRRHQIGHKRPSSSDTRNPDSIETSSRESWTSHQRRSDQVPGCGRRHSRSTKSSEMYAVFHM